MNKSEFVQKCGELLAIAKPHLIKCEYKIGKEIPKSPFEIYLEDDEYVVITCENGYTYKINITANSLIATAKAIFEVMAYK